MNFTALSWFRHLRPLSLCLTTYGNNEITFNIAHNPHMKCAEYRFLKLIRRHFAAFIARLQTINRRSFVLITSKKNAKTTIRFLPSEFAARKKVRYAKGFENYVISLFVNYMPYCRAASCQLGLHLR